MKLQRLPAITSIPYAAASVHARSASCSARNFWITLSKTAELMRGGKTQEEAERAAVGSLGPAEAISKGMNAVYRPSAAKYIFLAATLFLAFLNAAPWLAFLFNIPNMPLAVFPAEGATAVIGGADGPTSIFVSAGSWSMVSFILPLLLILFAGITVRLFLRPKFGGRNNGMRPRT